MVHSWVIYKITSPSKRIYIGKTRQFKKRMANYRCVEASKEQKLIHRSIKKYGFNNHKVEIIDKFESDNSYSSGKEMFWIKTYMSNAAKYPNMLGMNLSDGGDGGTGHKVSDENKMATSLRNKSNPKEVLRMSLGLKRGHEGSYKGKNRPRWVGEKISKSKKGKPLSDKNKLALKGIKKKCTIYKTKAYNKI